MPAPVLLILTTESELIVVRKNPESLRNRAEVHRRRQPHLGPPGVLGNGILIKDSTTLMLWGYLMSGNLCETFLFAALAVSAFAENWPQWRGPNLNGISNEKNLPVHWSPTENVAWKLAMPSKTGATPIIWGNNIFLNVADGDNLYLWCVDKTKGTPIWKKLIAGGNYKINKQNMSSPSPVTDGKSVYVMTGVGILKGFDFDGNELWTRDIQKDYGKFGLNWGYASSPLLYEDSALRAGAARDEDATIRRTSCASTRRPARRCGAWSARRMRFASRPIPTPRRSC